jgi:hypothetical protein
VMIKVRFMQLGRLQHGKNKSLFQNQKNFEGNSRVKQIRIDRIIVSGGLPEEMSQTSA